MVEQNILTMSMRKLLFTSFLTISISLFVGCNFLNKENQRLAENNSANLKLNKTIRILSYNIHHCNPPGEKDLIDLASIANTIADQQPDIVALQEVDVNTDRSGEGNQAAMIAKKLDMNYFFAKTIDYDGGEYGVAILSKYPMLETTIHELPTKGNEEARVLATAKVEVNQGTHILFGSTHLNSSKSSENRILQMKKIVEISNSINNMDVIIAGDFNAVPQSEVINIAEENFNNTCDDCKPTFPATTPSKVIDYIFFKSKVNNLFVSSYDVIEDSHSSDHRPVFAEINFIK